MADKMLLSFKLKSGQTAKGNVYNLVQLSAKYQIWARENHGVSDAESLACCIANQPSQHSIYFENSEEVERLAKSGFAKSKGKIPDLSEVGSKPFCYSSYTIPFS